jgi:hypothetical protein
MPLTTTARHLGSWRIAVKGGPTDAPFRRNARTWRNCCSGTAAGDNLAAINPCVGTPHNAGRKPQGCRATGSGRCRERKRLLHPLSPRFDRLLRRCAWKIYPDHPVMGVPLFEFLQGGQIKLFTLPQASASHAGLSGRGRRHAGNLRTRFFGELIPAQHRIGPVRWI